MKKCICILILIILTLCGCSKDKIELDSGEKNYDINYNYMVKGNTPDEFPILISDNPLDKRYEEICEEYDGSKALVTSQDS